MPLSGKGMLITLMDADPSEERDFNQWYDKEHIIERVGIPGFLEARRYVAVAAHPKYLNFYTTETLDSLRSPAYLQALQNPTAWTRHHMAKFRNFTRAVARVTSSRGRGRGGALAFSRIRPSGVRAPRQAAARRNDRVRHLSAAVGSGEGGTLIVVAVARMERSVIRDRRFPHCATLHAGYWPGGVRSCQSVAPW